MASVGLRIRISLAWTEHVNLCECNINRTDWTVN
jgi:hypothetical protein